MASEIRRLTKTEAQLFAPLIKLMSERRELYYNGVALFYLMKDLLLSAAQPIAATLDQEMRNSEMDFVNK